jgi:hypothetical protein
MSRLRTSYEDEDEEGSDQEVTSGDEYSSDGELSAPSYNPVLPDFDNRGRLVPPVSWGPRRGLVRDGGHSL